MKKNGMVLKQFPHVIRLMLNTRGAHRDELLGLDLRFFYPCHVRIGGKTYCFILQVRVMVSFVNMFFLLIVVIILQEKSYSS